MGKGLPMLAAAAATTLAAPAAAHADIVITTETLWRFGAPAYEITAGDKVSFKNNDLLSPGPHDVTSVAKAADGQPLFNSKTGAFNTSSAVERAELLPAGSYPFLCTIHTFMRSTLNVKANPAAPPDTTPPKVEAQVRSKSRKLVLKNGRVRVRLSSDGPVSLAVTTSTTIRRTTYGLAKRFAFKHPGGPLVVQVPLSGEARALLRRHKRLAVRVTLRARDSAGNLTVARATGTLR